ncbi:hypothetical protein [Rhizobium sp. LC145]|uniref:hypothetical protein n=1 Tax=Rhizobium sp. LC145 TaxID=1120688 RepID=UPI00062A1923|nr:hypothetical protein [Rhizobium sp. LC145]KKX25289.1 hypothetical protein YH62_25405 [Rhizobium sp. LC145]TKT45310.1 hypothetical protein FDR95_25565 [Rhizobiaceae bacterium LC148]
MRALLILLMTAGAALADEKVKALQTSAFYISTAFHCQRVVSSGADYQQALVAGQANLMKAGYSEKEAGDMIASVTSKLGQKPDPDGKLTEGLCRDMLKRLKQTE